MPWRLRQPTLIINRYRITILGQGEKYQEQLKQKQALGYSALNVLESYLQNHSFLVAKTYTIADIALYSYTHLAPEGGFNLARFPASQSWLKQIEFQPRYISITDARN